MNKNIYNDSNKDIMNSKSKNNLKIFNLKQSNILKFRDKNKKYTKYKSLKKEKVLSKEESLNYLFNKINEEKNLSEEYMNEFKKYFTKNKNISENDINKHINRKYEFNDFVNLCNGIDKKIRQGNIKNKWKRNYLRIGKYDDIKNLLEEEEKQDYFINHFLQNYMNSMDGKRSFYNCDNNIDYMIK